MKFSIVLVGALSLYNTAQLGIDEGVLARDVYSALRTGSRIASLILFFTDYVASRLFLCFHDSGKEGHSLVFIIRFSFFVFLLYAVAAISIMASSNTIAIILRS